MNFSAVAIVFEIALERQIIIIVPFLLDHIYYQLISFPCEYHLLRSSSYLLIQHKKGGNE